MLLSRWVTSFKKINNNLEWRDVAITACHWHSGGPEQESNPKAKPTIEISLREKNVKPEFVALINMVAEEAIDLGASMLICGMQGICWLILTKREIDSKTYFEVKKKISDLEYHINKTKEIINQKDGGLI